MTNQEVINLTKGIRQIKGYRGVPFNYAIVKNLDRLEPEFLAFQKMEADIAKIVEEFDTEREALAIEYCEKDASNRPILVKGINYKIEESKVEEFNTKFDALREKHKEAIEKRDKEWADYETLLGNENTTYEPYMIDMAHLPSDILTEDFKTISKLIKE